MQLDEYKRRLQYGFYHKNERLSLGVELPQVTEVKEPQHFRLFFEDGLWDSNRRMFRKNRPRLENEPLSEDDETYIRRAQKIAHTVEWLGQNIQKKLGSLAFFQSSRTSKGITFSEGEECNLDGLHIFEWAQIQQVLENCSLVVGMHPDQATGAIVEFALHAKKPFAVVPCCVYSDLFPKRHLPNGKQVSSYNDLIDWIVAKDPQHIHVEELPFEGKNKVVYYIP
jgi:hypothetical protein